MEHMKTLSLSQQQFSGELFNAIASQSPGENVIVSPLSIFVAIMMALLGSRTETRHEIKNTLHLNKTRVAHHGFQKLYESLKPSMNDETLTIANNIFLDSQAHLQSQYKTDLKTFYDVDPVSCDFSQDAEGGRRTINKWVKSKTHGMIKNLFGKGSIDSTTKAVLVNAVNFKGSWADTFDKNHTTKDSFFNIDGSSATNAIMMNKHDHKVQYGQNEHAKWVKLPYNGDYSATFVLPLDPHDVTEDTMNKLQSYVTSTHDILNKLTTSGVKLTRLAIPKFQVKFQIELKKILKKMGIKKAFERDADFSKMLKDHQVSISSVVHQAVMKVDEHGTEAAAASGVVFSPRSLVLNPVKYDFVANRPFMMIVEHVPSSTIMFMGKIMNVVKN